MCVQTQSVGNSLTQADTEVLTQTQARMRLKDISDHVVRAASISTEKRKGRVPT